MKYEHRCHQCSHDFPLAHMKMVDTFTGECPECEQPIAVSPEVARLREAEEQIEYLQGLLGEAVWQPVVGSSLEFCVFCDVSSIADKHEDRCRYDKAVER